MKKTVLYVLLAAALFTSCATASLSKYRGVGRIKRYDFYSYDVPPAFDGFRIGFASDFHYESRFTRKRLDNAIRALQSLDADVLLLGGDYGSPKGGDMDTLFTALGKVFTPYGTYGVMGNHDYGYCYAEVFIIFIEIGKCMTGTAITCTRATSAISFFSSGYIKDNEQ